MIIPDAIRIHPTFIAKLDEIKAHPDWSQYSIKFQERRAVWTGFDELNRPGIAMQRVDNPDLREFLKGELEDELHTGITLARDGREEPNPDYINPNREYSELEIQANKYRYAEDLLCTLDNPGRAGWGSLQVALGEDEAAKITREFLQANNITKEYLQETMTANEIGFRKQIEIEKEYSEQMRREMEKQGDGSDSRTHTMQGPHDIES